MRETPTPRSLFVVGAARSGTTLLRLMLGAHPHVHGGPEDQLALLHLARWHRIDSSVRRLVHELWAFHTASGPLVTVWGLEGRREDLTRRMVGRLAAEVLRAVVRPGTTVGIGDGAFVSVTADALEESATPVAITVVPLCGGFWTTGHELEPYRRVGEALGGQVRGLMAPGLVDDAATRSALVAHAGIQAIAEFWERLDVALFGIGGPAWSVSLVGETIERQLEAAEAVGEVLVAPFDLDGRFVCPALRDRVIAFDARRLGRVPTAIGVAAGEGKVRPILGALRAGIVQTLVTDVATAEAVVALDEATLALHSGRPR